MTDFKVNKKLADNTVFKERFVDAIRTCLDVEPPSDYVDEWIHGNPPDGYFHLQEWVINQERFPLWAQGISFLEAMWGMADDPCEGRGHTTKDCMENKKVAIVGYLPRNESCTLVYVVKSTNGEPNAK